MKINKFIFIILILSFSSLFLCACQKEEESDAIVLRVSNWEEYIDLGDWDEDEAIELDDGTVILGENSLVEDFEEWFYENYGREVVVEYSTFGTNEDLYNQITLGDKFDLVCPSEYMIMKMMTEGMLEPFSDDFYDKDIENNFYSRNVSPYIINQFDNLNINNESIKNYAAGYMWGTMGILYNPEFVTEEEASHWDILLDRKFEKNITIKDSVREAYFAAASILKYDEITDDNFINSSDYLEALSDKINATDPETVNGVEEILSKIQKNVYSFETDSGKADMVTGKVVANLQWSGDAVYSMDQADEDGVELCYAYPTEANNLWFDGWCMLKDSIDGDAEKKMAAEAFINYLAISENAIRNMYYIGYTSVCSGGEDDLILDYLKYCYEEEKEEEELIPYDISYFFGRDAIINATEYSTRRQLGAQYPSEEVMGHSVIMKYFDKEGNERVNRMWTNVRCFDLSTIFN